MSNNRLNQNITGHLLGWLGAVITDQCASLDEFNVYIELSRRVMDMEDEYVCVLISG